MECDILGFHGRIFMECDILGFFENLSENSRFFKIGQE